MTQRLAFPLCLLLAVLALAGSLACGSARRTTPFVGTHAPDSPRLAAGERVFNRHCQGCHPGGEGGVGPGLNNKPAPGFVLRFQIRHGLGAMPGFSEAQISREELDALVAYMKWRRGLKH